MIAFHHTLYSGPLPEGVATHECYCGCLLTRRIDKPRYYTIIQPCDRYYHRAGMVFVPNRTPKLISAEGIRWQRGGRDA